MDDLHSGLIDAINELTQQLLRVQYRALVMEQTTLRLLAHLAVTDKDAAQRIAAEVRELAMVMGNDRDSPDEALAQESMLQLLNNLLKASGH